MKPVRFFVQSAMFACTLCACGHSDVPETPPAPPPPPEETYITVSAKGGEPVESYDLSFASYSESLVIKSNDKWEAAIEDDAEWLSISATSAATAVLSVSPNTGRSARDSKIVIYSLDGSVTVEIPVAQGFGHTIGASPIKDLMLIYDGDTYSDVTKNRLRTYVASDDETPQWLFDGYLFLTSKFNGRTFDAGNGVNHALKQDWLDILDYYLEEGHSIPALEAAVKEVKDAVPGDFHRRKVVLFMPDPVAGQTDWGEIDGREMDFNLFPDRVAACKWYVDRVLDKFSQKEFENIQLAGLYWLVENGSFLPKYMSMLADYIHSKNLDFYWIPYYKAFGYADWNDYGFDHAYYQPNYCFSTTIPKQRLYDAYDEAVAAGMSLEIEFDTHFPFERNVAYVDVYEELGVFDSWNLAYYGGSSFETWAKGIPSEYAFYKRISNIIAKRQKDFYNH